MSGFNEHDPYNYAAILRRNGKIRVLPQETGRNDEMPEKKPERGKRSENEHAGITPPDYKDDYDGEEMRCPECRTTWITSTNRTVERVGKLDFDYFKCRCRPQHRYPRYR